MNDALYRFITGTLDAFLWGGELIGEENLPEKGPAIFIANHLGPLGPIGSVCSLPQRLYPWIISNMVDPDQAADWLQVDFTEKTLKLQPPASKTLAKLLSKITVPLLSNLGCIPVYHGYEKMQKTWTISLPLLLEGHFLLICPEDPELPADPMTHMTPFQKSFARLAEMYYEKTRKRLAFYPVAVHGSHRLKVGAPIFFNPLNPVGIERHRLKDWLEETVARMYLELEQEDFPVALAPVRK